MMELPYIEHETAYIYLYEYGYNLPDNLIFRNKYNWNYIDIEKITYTDFYIKYENSLYQTIIDLDYKIMLKLVK